MKSRISLLLLFLCAALFAGTLLALLKWRFEAGDIYPPYSSLRSDPLGTMAFYESLERMSHLAVRRDLNAANRLPAGENTTYLHFAGEPGQWREMDANLVREIERFLLEGGRLVIMLSPQTHEETEKAKTGENTKPAEEEEGSQQVDVLKKWGLDLDFKPFQKTDDHIEPVLVKNVSSRPLPAELRWHSTGILKALGPAWQAIYSRAKDPVAAERKFGQGSLVFATDSYLTSNEAMRRDRQADFLVWLIGPNRKVVFDESHFGIVSDPGLAALARKYRLYGVLVALLVLASLFIWKNTSSLLPPPPARKEGLQIIGRDSAAGFAGLLRRNISPDKLLEVCAAEWGKTFARETPSSLGNRKKIAAILAEENARPVRQRNPAEAYRRICLALKRPPNSKASTHPPA